MFPVNLLGGGGGRCRLSGRRCGPPPRRSPPRLRLCDAGWAASSTRAERRDSGTDDPGTAHCGGDDRLDGGRLVSCAVAAGDKKRGGSCREGLLAAAAAAAAVASLSGPLGNGGWEGRFD